MNSSTCRPQRHGTLWWWWWPTDEQVMKDKWSKHSLVLCLPFTCCRGRQNSTSPRFHFLLHPTDNVCKRKCFWCVCVQTTGMVSCVFGLSPRSRESVWGRWEKEVLLYTWSRSFSFTWVMVSQSSTLVGSGWDSFTPPLCTNTFSVCRRRGEAGSGFWGSSFSCRWSRGSFSPGSCTPRPLAADGCHSGCTWPFLLQHPLVPYQPGVLWPWTACTETHQLSPTHTHTHQTPLALNKQSLEESVKNSDKDRL